MIVLAAVTDLAVCLSRYSIALHLVHTLVILASLQAFLLI